MIIKVIHILDIIEIDIIALNKIIQGAYFFEKFNFLNERVGILLIIKNPIKVKIHKFK